MSVLTSDKIVARILNRRGSRINLPQPLEPGEMGWCLDTKQLYVGLDEMHSIAAVQTFNGINDATVNAFLNNDIIMFSTPFIRLLTPTIETNDVPHELNALDKLSEIPASSFLLENNRYAINSLESKIRIINQFRSLIPDLIGAGNYPVTYLYDWEKTQPVTATATATLSGGQISTVTVTNNGLGYFNNEAPIVTVTGNGTNGAVSATVNQNGTLSLNIDNAGSGYTTISLTIAAPQTIAEMTPDLYRFNFIVGIENSYPSMSTFITDLNDDSIPTKMFVQCLQDTDGYQIAFYSADIAGAGGYGYTLSNGLVYLPAIRRATNLAGIINKLSDPTGNGLVTTKQNVEILTEYSSLPMPAIQLLSYKLDPSGTYVNVENDGSDILYNSATLQFDTNINDVQVLNYSVVSSDKLCLRVGTLTIKTLYTGSVIIDDEYTENRDPSITPLMLSGPDISFSHTNASGVVTITYKHNFATPVYLRISSKEWNSFII